MNPLRDEVKYSVTCGRCRVKTEETIGWLADHQILICPGCGDSIILRAFERDIGQLDDWCRQLDGSPRKLD